MNSATELACPPALAACAALFLDIDGTLLDFAPAPSQVVVPPDLAESLIALHHVLGGAVAFLSGRPIEQIDALSPIPALAVAGLHGLHIRRKDGSLERESGNIVLRELADAAQHGLQGLEGAFLEIKELGLALHFRRAPAHETRITSLGNELLRLAGPAFTLQKGDCVLELRVRGRNKGDALSVLMASSPFEGRQPWVVGDDHTDEPAFLEAKRWNGIGIIVGNRRPTVAPYALHDPAAARQWIASNARRLTSAG